MPKVVKTDNGPLFNGETFTRWGASIGFHHRKITPLWPAANGEVERMMDQPSGEDKLETGDV